MKSSDKELTREQFLTDVSKCADAPPLGILCKRLVEKFDKCTAISFYYFETDNGHERRCWLKKKNCVNSAKDANKIMDFTIENDKLRFSLGKKERLRTRVLDWAKFDLPAVPGGIVNWCIESPENEQKFRDWIIAAATR